MFSAAVKHRGKCQKLNRLFQFIRKQLSKSVFPFCGNTAPPPPGGGVGWFGGGGGGGGGGWGWVGG